MTRLCLMLLLLLPAQARAQFTFTTNNGAITITGYSGPGGVVTVPSTINGLPVTGIGDRAFRLCTNVTSATMPTGITNIGGYAFAGCSGLRSVSIPNSVTDIGYDAFGGCTRLTQVTVPNSVVRIQVYAFSYCSSLTNVVISYGVITIGDKAFSGCPLTSVTIPSSVSSIGGQAFEDCPALLAINVDSANAYYASLDGVLFDKSQRVLIQCPGGKAGSYTIPPNVRSIGNYAFASCANVASVTIPGTVFSIGNCAFIWCGSLTNVTISNGVTSIGYDAFEVCINLTNVIIPKSVTTIHTYAFANCTNLRSVYFEGNPPSAIRTFFQGPNPTIYCLPGTTGWDTAFPGCPTAFWTLPWPVILDGGPNFGLQTNGFGFTISWLTNIPVVVEACTNPAHAVWLPVSTNTLTGGLSIFSDPDWTNFPARFYRVRPH